MKNYSLTFTWSNSPPVTVGKRYSRRDAVKWAETCLAICGKNHHGTPCLSAVLSEIGPGGKLTEVWKHESTAARHARIAREVTGF